jgi:hypothetical protein
MSTYARIVAGAVFETFSTTLPITDFFPTAAGWVPCPDGTPQGSIATETAGVWTFTAPPVPPPPTVAQQAAAAMSAGLAIASTSTPALNGTFDVSASAQDHMQAEMIALLNSGGTTFADGTTSVVWPDMAGVNHTFTAVQARALFLAAGAYVAALFKAMNGTLAALPPASAMIA